MDLFIFRVLGNYKKYLFDDNFPVLSEVLEKEGKIQCFLAGAPAESLSFLFGKVNSLFYLCLLQFFFITFHYLQA